MTAAGEAAAAPAAAERKRWWQRLTVGQTVALVSAIILAITGGANLVYLLWPGTKPDPPAVKRVATVETIAFDRNVTRAQFFQRTGNEPASGDDSEANGNVFYIRAQIEGYKESTLRLKWFTYRADDNVRLQGLRSNERLEGVFEPSAPINQQIAQVWVPTPAREGEYFVRFELYARKVLLAIVDTEKFSIVEF